MDTMTATYVIPAENRDAVAEKLTKLNRKATQLGTSPITVTFSHDHIETWTRYSPSADKDIEYSREWLKAEVVGAIATLSGYYFRATLHHTTDGNIVASLPGYEVPREYRNAPSACHHCKTTRRRNATYLVESKDGLMQVGQNCVQDFFGGNDPYKVAKWAELLGAFDSWFTSMEDVDYSNASRREDSSGLMTFLAQNATVIRLDGWVSKKVANEREMPATVFTTWDALFGFPMTLPKERYALQTKYKITEEDKARALEVYTWAKATFAAEGTEPENDYLHNLAVITRAGIVSKRTGGLAASMEAAWKRATQPKPEYVPGLVSGHVGTVGERLRGVKVSLIGSHELPPTEWGTRMLVRLADDAGNIFVWFTGGDGLHGQWDFGNDVVRAVEVGDTMWLTGTVKRHGVFGEVKQTEMSRCQLASQAPVEKVKKSKKAVAA